MMKTWTCPQCNKESPPCRLDDLPEGWVIVQTDEDASIKRPTAILCSSACAEKHFINENHFSAMIAEASGKLPKVDADSSIVHAVEVLRNLGRREVHAADVAERRSAMRIVGVPTPPVKVTTDSVEAQKLYGGKEVHELCVDTKNVTVLLERPEAVWQVLCSSAKSLRHLAIYNVSDDALISVATKIEYIMSCFLEEQKGKA